MARRVAQIASQFMILVGFLFVVFVAFVAAIGGKYVEISDRQEAIAVKDLALKLRGEINLAYSTYDGYERTFTIPATLEGRNFTISIFDQNVLMVQSEDEEYTVIIPTVNGTLVKGNNTIRKTGGIVCIGGC